MNCEDVELELSGADASVEAREHLEGCESCRQTAKLLGLAALPAITQSERLMLNALSASTQQAFRAQRARGQGLRRLATLGLAAGLGALLGSALMYRPAPDRVLATAAPVVRTVTMTAPDAPEFDFEVTNLSDDEVFPEVGWPSPTEGDL